MLFAIGKDGTIDPNRNDNIPGLEALRSADLMIIATRFRNLPDDQMKEVVDYVESGRPIIGMRTATHAFNCKGKTYAKYTWNSKDWDGGFGRQVLGETWVNHHGHHGKREHARNHRTGGQGPPDPSRHQGRRHLGPDRRLRSASARRLHAAGARPGAQGDEADRSTRRGQEERPDDARRLVKTYTGEQGKSARIFTTTMGAATDLETEGTRRLLVNAAYWAVGLEDKIPEKSDVSLVGEYHPLPFGNDRFKKGARPEDFATK